MVLCSLYVSVRSKAPAKTYYTKLQQTSDKLGHAAAKAPRNPKALSSRGLLTQCSGVAPAQRRHWAAPSDGADVAHLGAASDGAEVARPEGIGMAECVSVCHQKRNRRG